MSGPRDTLLQAVAFLQANIDSGMDRNSAEYVNMANTQRDRVVAAVQAVLNLTVAHGTEMISAIACSGFPLHARTHMISAINSKVTGASPSTQTTRTAMQEGLFLHNYLTKEEWEVLFDPNKAAMHPTPKIAPRNIYAAISPHG